MSNVEYYPKHNIPVRVTLIDGTNAFGVVYVRQGQRILDMLCDERAFFPLRSKDGISLLNKDGVMKINIMTVEEIADKEELFPDVNLGYLKNNSW